MIFCPWNKTLDVGRFAKPNTVVYSIPRPFETRHPHVLDVTWAIVGGNDGTFALLSQNSTVRSQGSTPVFH